VVSFKTIESSDKNKLLPTPSNYDSKKKLRVA